MGQKLEPALFDYLPISAPDLEGTGIAPVSREFLRILINELARRQRLDEAWYAETYPDVEGVQLVGHIKSLREHFATSGYVGGRPPAELPFDPEWYRSRDPDPAEAYPPRPQGSGTLAGPCSVLTTNCPGILGGTRTKSAPFARQCI